MSKCLSCERKFGSIDPDGNLVNKCGHHGFKKFCKGCGDTYWELEEDEKFGMYNGLSGDDSRRLGY